MEHLREISKIAEWGLRGDRTRVSAYLNQLIERLEQKGDEKAVSRLKILIDDPSYSVTTSSIGGSSRLPVDGESRLSLADETKVDSKNFPVILDSNTSARIDEFINLVKNADELEAHGVGLSPSLITYGPPGTGKTQLARHIAGRLGMPIVTARADTLISSFLGSTSKNLRSLFDHVSHRNCVFFLDEIDAFAKLRDDQQELGELKRVVVSLLQNLDAMDHHTVLIAATNHEHLLDPAIWRRFSFRIPISLPKTKERLSMLKIFLKSSYSENVDLETIAQLTSGLSGSDLRTLSLDAVRDAIVRNRPTVDNERLVKRVIETHFKEDVDFENPSRELIRSVQNISPDYFNGKRLAKVFGVSASTISRKLNKGEGR